MTRPKAALATLLTLSAILIVLVASTYGQLPGRVASHFMASGRPDGWMSRPSYAAFTLIGASIVSLICAGPIYLARFLDDSLVNIPNRSYWLATERRTETYDRMLSFGLWLAALCVGLFIGLHLLTLQANRSDPVSLPLTDGLALMAAFLAGVAWLCYQMCSRFWRVELVD